MNIILLSTLSHTEWQVQVGVRDPYKLIATAYINSSKLMLKVMLFH